MTRKVFDKKTEALLGTYLAFDRGTVWYLDAEGYVEHENWQDVRIGLRKVEVR